MWRRLALIGVLIVGLALVTMATTMVQKTTVPGGSLAETPRHTPMARFDENRQPENDEGATSSAEFDLTFGVGPQTQQPQAQRPKTRLHLLRDLSAGLPCRNSDFPNTYIRQIKIDLTSPSHAVTLEWDGPQAADQPAGPFHSSPGAGLGINDCNDVAESNRSGSNCTPKGTFVVQEFSEYLPAYPFCRYVTWFHLNRAIAIHSHTSVPYRPASHGCVRMRSKDAQLIQENSIIGKTEVEVGGTWSRY